MPPNRKYLKKKSFLQTNWMKIQDAAMVLEEQPGKVSSFFFTYNQLMNWHTNFFKLWFLQLVIVVLCYILQKLSVLQKFCFIVAMKNNK